MSPRRTTTTISTLPDNVFVEIFSLCRREEVDHATRAVSHRPWKWQRLAHVCRTWRHIMFASSRHLRLELLCTYNTPVKKNIGRLPALPIVVSFLGCYFRRRDRDNLIAALRQHRDRIRVVEVDVPELLFEDLATAMQKPFPALAHLRFESDPEDDMPPLPDTFLGGSAPCLQTIYISGIPFPAAPILLSSARDLVDLDLSNIPLTGYISPEAMVTSLGVLPRLKYLTFRFEEYWISYPGRMRLPSITRTVLPALTIFYFDGLFEYFEDLVAQIDAPQLVCLGAKYLDLGVTDFQIPQLCDFIDRSEKLRFRRAELLIQPDTVAIELTQGIQTSFSLVVRQDAIYQVVNQFSAILSNVDRLFVCSESEEGDDEPDNRISWFELFRPFTAVKVLSVDEGISWQIPLEFEEITDDRAAELLPALELLCLENQPVGYIEDFVTARQNVGRPVTVIEEEFEEHLSIFDVSE